jgi:hypothetical protein
LRLGRIGAFYQLIFIQPKKKSFRLSARRWVRRLHLLAQDGEDWMIDVELRVAVTSGAPAMLALLRSVSEEGDALPFLDGVDVDFIDG